MLKEFLGARDAAAEMGLSVETLRLWRAANIGPESFMIMGRVYYRPEKIREWLDSQIANTLRGGV